MDNTFVYRPNHIDGWFVPFSVSIGILAFMLAGVFLQMGDYKSIPIVAFGIVSFWLSKQLYDSANVVVLFELEGLRIVGGRGKNIKYFPWTELPFACYSRNYKGHLFLVLSPKALSKTEAKRYVNRGANMSQTCVDSVVVIHISAIQTAEQLKSHIIRYVKNVSSFDA